MSNEYENPPSLSVDTLIGRKFLSHAWPMNEWLQFNWKLYAVSCSWSLHLMLFCFWESIALELVKKCVENMHDFSRECLSGCMWRISQD